MNMKKGFTLIEIMIVVAIIAILAAIAIPNFIKYRETAQNNTCKSNLGTLETAAEAYEIAVSSTNGTVGTEINLGSNKEFIDESKGTGFLKKVPKCPKGGTYTLEKVNGAWKASCNGDGHTALTSD